MEEFKLSESINIKSLEVFGYHGIFNEEKILGQKYIVDLSLKIKDSFHVLNNDLNKTVDYSKLIEFIREYFKNNKRDLLETICDEIIFEIFNRFSNVWEVNLEILKPAHHVSIGFCGMSVSTHRKVHKVYIALGSNLGNREENINSAYNLLEECGIKIIKKSSVIETEPYGDVPQDKFLNSVIEVNTILTPRELMDTLLNIEKELKRERIIRWGPRTIDLDILLYDDEIINEENVIIPHYDMHNREFVLESLCEINKFSYHPRLRKFSFEMMNDLKDKFNN